MSKNDCSPAFGQRLPIESALQCVALSEHDARRIIEALKEEP